MKITDHAIKDVKLISFGPRGDARGNFIRVWDKAEFVGAGLDFPWVQENQALTLKKGTLRGLHYQEPPFAETKFVRCIAGSILDVFVDLRIGASTHGQWGSVEISSAANNAVIVPRGFAHAYLTLEDNCLVSYKVDATYNQASERGIRWDDPLFNIKWPVQSPILSDKDQNWPYLQGLPGLKIGV